MNHREIFGEAKWISATDSEMCPIISKCFTVHSPKRAIINILGFASFVFYINGKRASDDYFMPLASDFEPRNSPTDELLAHRSYVSTYDITNLLKEGENTISVLLGNGWYTGHTGIYKEVSYGNKKLCFAIDIEGQKENVSIISDENCVFRESSLKKSDLNFGEEQDFSDYDEKHLIAHNTKEWKNVCEATPPNTEYYFTDCPPDRVIGELTPTVITKASDTDVIYDVGMNITGFPILYSEAVSEIIEVTFSEDICDGDLHPKNSHKQKMLFHTHGKELSLSPLFTWFGFRYFRVKGAAKVISVKRIHSDVKQSSRFECDNDTLNWLYSAYINTQLCNMHQGIPSDCPHIERRGYTGDGQLTCRAAMLTLDAESFYKKWIADISDCQDRKSGHVQYTAPYTHSGGGPGGWGSAIVKVPYEFWNIYGDDNEIKALYSGMLFYIDYLDAHSELGLVTSDRDGEWCLGEWCVPSSHPGNSVLPPQFVNTYFCIKALTMLCEIAEHLGDASQIPMLKEKIEHRKSAIKSAYYNKNNGDFLGNREGANAFALDIGLGDERTREHFIAHYEKCGYYDTGIFGTDIVTRLLFEYGRGDIAYTLMTATEPHGFGKWKECGATSLWEYWNSPRSMSHPMFGASVAYLFDYILGIRQAAGTHGYRELIISPALNTPIKYASGYITVASGKIEVSYKKTDGNINISIKLPNDCSATLVAFGEHLHISEGESTEINLPIIVRGSE